MSEKKTEVWITYTIDGITGQQVAGPYPVEELTYQLKDIRGYEGVNNVDVRFVEPIKYWNDRLLDKAED